MYLCYIFSLIKNNILMKKILIAFALVAFLGSASAVAITNMNNNNVAIAVNEDDPKKDKNSDKDKKDCKTEKKSCCSKGKK
jgi:uncharacterized protein YxeA